jgi:hypothetical protein
MQTLPQHPRRRNLDPKLPKGRKKTSTTVFMSGLAVLIVMFAMGQFPRANQFFSDANTTLQSHNDEIVAAMLHYGPALLLTAGVVGVALMASSSIRNMKRRKTAA